MFDHKNRVVFIVFTISLLDEVVVPVCPNQRGHNTDRTGRHISWL